ncbi:hypothetical protein L1049_007735 [Liquidambar formosana]|uniref:MULE transposase domain-containing protein n=1 Tax=Liquidambar formosana TaxID=63359 RepID=A0AAP0S9H8_LIQFO
MDEDSKWFKRLFPLAFVVVDSETEDNWRWFFENLLEIVGDDRQITFISDRNNGLKSALPKVFPTAYYAYCLHHLKINLRDKVRGHKSYKLSEGKEQVGYFLNDCPFQCWANAYFQGQRYGEMCLNVAESFNAWIKEARFLPITNLVDMIRSQIMGQMCTRRLEASSWNIVLYLKIDERLDEELDKRRT